VDPADGNAADLRANFTIKGITAPLPLPVTITEVDDGAIRISGKTKVDRAQFDLGWNKFGMMGATATAAADAVFVRAPR
jgi:polyisoprenoid-binding protein YceI